MFQLANPSLCRRHELWIQRVLPHLVVRLYTFSAIPHGPVSCARWDVKWGNHCDCVSKNTVINQPLKVPLDELAHAFFL
jgi:hypothetical protein